MGCTMKNPQKSQRQIRDTVKSPSLAGWVYKQGWRKKRKRLGFESLKVKPEGSWNWSTIPSKGLRERRKWGTIHAWIERILCTAHIHISIISRIDGSSRFFKYSKRLSCALWRRAKLSSVNSPWRLLQRNGLSVAAWKHHFYLQKYWNEKRLAMPWRWGSIWTSTMARRGCLRRTQTAASIASFFDSLVWVAGVSASSVEEGCPCVRAEVSNFFCLKDSRKTCLVSGSLSWGWLWCSCCWLRWRPVEIHCLIEVGIFCVQTGQQRNRKIVFLLSFVALTPHQWIVRS